MDAHTQDNSITEVMFVTGKFGKPLPVVDSFLFYPKDAERVLSRAGAGDATQRSSSATTGPGNASAGKQNTTTPTTSVSSRTSSTCSVCEMVSNTAQHARAHEARRLVCPEGDKDMQEEEHRLPVCKGRPQERAMSSRGGGHRRDTDTCREHDPHQRGQEYYRTCSRVGCPTALSRRARLRRRDVPKRTGYTLPSAHVSRSVQTAPHSPSHMSFSRTNGLPRMSPSSTQFNAMQQNAALVMCFVEGRSR